mgnify:CR=1 FL=1
MRRGATSNPPSRHAAQHTEPCDDGWHQEPLPPLRTRVDPDACRSVIAWNESPDIPFDRSVNPYRGCEHGCVYCYARPGHAWLGLSPGLDFETRLFAKADAAALLREELAAPSYRCAPIALGAATDVYQPIERGRRITRAVLELLAELRHPVTVVTKSALIERDLDVLADLARDRLVHVQLSVTTLRGDLARRLEPRAASPHRRLEAIARLREAAIPVGVLVAPVVPVLTDSELETVLAAARDAGAGAAGYTLLRLPLEVAGLFRAWLEEHAAGHHETGNTGCHCVRSSGGAHGSGSWRRASFNTRSPSWCGGNHTSVREGRGGNKNATQLTAASYRLLRPAERNSTQDNSPVEGECR